MLVAGVITAVVGCVVALIPDRASGWVISSQNRSWQTRMGERTTRGTAIFLRIFGVIAIVVGVAIIATNL